MRRRSARARCVLFPSSVGLLVLTASGMLPTTEARQATPSAFESAISCNVDPRSLTEILALTKSTPGASTPVRPLPGGDPADPATTTAIAAVLREMGDCLTAGDMLRFYALHSDDWIRRSLGETEGFATMSISTPPLADGDRAVYLGPWHVRILPDGRVLAAVLLRVGEELRPDPDRTRVLLFVHRDGRWLVDETLAHVRLAGCENPVEVAAVVGPPPGALFDSWSLSCG